jgi:hypothetical protein
MKKSELDPILQDIQEAVKGGYFDDWQPSELSVTPVEELLGQVGMMSDARRRKHLESIGNQGGGGEARPPGVFGLPADDQIRYSYDDVTKVVFRLSEEAFGAKLESVIESWSEWRTVAHSLKQVTWLSRDGPAAAKGQQGKWLSR